MNKKATVTILGSTGPGVAENMMSGTVLLKVMPANMPAPLDEGSFYSQEATQRLAVVSQ